jgi:hypothetical protein
MTMVKVKVSQARNLRGGTNWPRVKAMSEAEILAAARGDLQARELRPHELAQFRRVRKKAG